MGIPQPHTRAEQRDTHRTGAETKAAAHLRQGLTPFIAAAHMEHLLRRRLLSSQPHTARSQERCQSLTPDTEIVRHLSQRPTGCICVLRRGQQLLADPSLLADMGALLGWVQGTTTDHAMRRGHANQRRGKFRQACR